MIEIKKRDREAPCNCCGEVKSVKAVTFGYVKFVVCPTCYAELRAAIERDTWVTDGSLPEIGNFYRTQYILNKKKLQTDLYYEDGKWFDDDQLGSCESNKHVIAWRELPAGPEDSNG